jgi:bacterioferritin
MKGHPQVIQVLNEVLTGELTSVNQYFLASRIFENWGYDRLCAKLYKESIDEMKHADSLIKRILYLEGLPNLQKLDKIHTGESVLEQLKADHDTELAAVARLNSGIKLSRDLGDVGSAELLEHILRSEEDHIEWLEAQLELIKQVGEQNYLSQQIRKGDD